MTGTTAAWPRPEYAPGGGRPALFYVVYGPLPADWTVSRSAFRTRGVPAGVDMLTYGPDTHADVVDSFRKGPLWQAFGSAEPEIALAAGRSDTCVVLRGAPEDDRSLDYLRDAIGLVEWLFSEGAVAVFDALSFQWHGADGWHALFEAGTDALSRHVSLLLSHGEGGDWLRTRGMIKFGRPDLSVLGVTAERKPVAVELVRRLIRLQALGGVVPEGQRLWPKGAPGGMVCRHSGDHDDPDFNNRHIRIDWIADAPAAQPIG